MTQTIWTKAAYNALFDWPNGPAGRQACRAALREAGLEAELEKLEHAPSLAYWSHLTIRAAEAVGPRIVEDSARESGYLETPPDHKDPRP